MCSLCHFLVPYMEYEVTVCSLLITLLNSLWYLGRCGMWSQNIEVFNGSSQLVNLFRHYLRVKRFCQDYTLCSRWKLVEILHISSSDWEDQRESGKKLSVKCSRGEVMERYQTKVKLTQKCDKTAALASLLFATIHLTHWSGINFIVIFRIDIIIIPWNFLNIVI